MRVELEIKKNEKGLPHFSSVSTSKAVARHAGPGSKAVFLMCRTNVCLSPQGLDSGTATSS